jgi:four helix bundle protein
MPARENPIVDKTFNFSLQIIDFSERLGEMKKLVFARQILRSGTSIGANVAEAQMAASRKDFVHKMRIAAKEAEETHYWLRLCEHAKTYPDPGNLLLEIKEIIKILNRIIRTAGKTL